MYSKSLGKFQFEEISKIMNTTNPDMKKVEKLNNEIYQIKANHMTKMQQNIMKTN